MSKRKEVDAKLEFPGADEQEAKPDDVGLTAEGVRFLRRALEELDERPDRIKETRNLRCLLSAAERDEKRIEAANRYAARDVVLGKLAVLQEQVKSLKKQAEGADQDASALNAIATAGEEWRDVECATVEDPGAWLDGVRGVQWDVRRDTLAVEGYRNIPAPAVKRQGDLFS